jgi:excisionase family DNA binding protein
MKDKQRSRHLLKPKEVGEILGFKERTIAKWCREGKIEGAIKIGRVWRIPRDWRP